MTASTLTQRHSLSTSPISFLWLELTGKCGLECVHCYAESGPSGTHGSMTADDWKSVIDQAVAAGVSMVQFIGGEPTLHPELPRTAPLHYQHRPGGRGVHQPDPHQGIVVGHARLS